MNNLLAVFIGGGLGSLSRFGISTLIYAKYKTVFPLATLISNTLSCVVLVIAIVLFSEKLDINPTFRMLIITGFCGGFSTFSTFSFETVELIRSGNTLYAVANIAISLGLCIGVVFYVLKNS